MVKSQLDYCSSVWSPYRKGDIEALEKVQKKATNILPQFKNQKYEDVSEHVNFQHCTLDVFEGMIETFKIAGIYLQL